MRFYITRLIESGHFFESVVTQKFYFQVPLLGSKPQNIRLSFVAAVNHRFGKLFQYIPVRPEDKRVLLEWISDFDSIPRFGGANETHSCLYNCTAFHWDQLSSKIVPGTNAQSEVQVKEMC